MLLKYFYDSNLAHASYMVGCQATGEAIIVDPARDISPYLAAAQKEGMQIIASTETHIHADYVSGSRELAERTKATLYLSDEGDENWKYDYAAAYPHQLLKDGDSFQIGRLRFDVMHTPGHTPEHISLLLTDQGGGADKPMGIFTGDFVFVGSVGRPDLLEKAAGVANASQEGAEQLFASLQRFKKLPDYLQVWPAHGAGSSCGKGLGAIPSSTVGYEKMFNAALGFDNEQSFAEMILDGQPAPPTYFALMKRVNREGPAVLGEQTTPPKCAANTLPTVLAAGHMVIDTNLTAKFAAAHVPGTINIPFGSLASWGGWLADYERPLYLIASADQAAEGAKILAEIGIDAVAGYFDPAELSAQATQSFPEKTADQLSQAIINNEVKLIDVRNQDEWEAGHLPNAHHIMLGTLPNRLDEIGKNGRSIVVQCRSGVRSAIAASILQANGIENVTNLAGGYLGWAKARLPIQKDG